MTSIYTEETKGQIKQTTKTFIAVIKTKQSPSRIRRGYLFFILPSNAWQNKLLTRPLRKSITTSVSADIFQP